EPYVLAAKKLNIPITQCLVVEDSVNGLRSGKAAGAKVLAFTTSLSAGYLSEADYIAQDFNDISCEKIRSYINSGE
ncbi:MAG: HAD family phosphatase, partial [Candidatus Marinimicrobia bacterium]|nr:HAD family phosphatase [Candidatus Neomarinimicrobiota bacterium]